jgi:hypothetical protein
MWQGTPDGGFTHIVGLKFWAYYSSAHFQKLWSQWGVMAASICHSWGRLWSHTLCVRPTPCQYSCHGCFGLSQTDIIVTFKVLWNFSCNLIDMYCRFCPSWKFACVWMIGMCPGLVLNLGHWLSEVHKCLCVLLLGNWAPITIVSTRKLRGEGTVQRSGWKDTPLLPTNESVSLRLVECAVCPCIFPFLSLHL